MCSTEVRLSVRVETAAHVCVSEECRLSKSTMSAQSVRHLAALLMDSLLTSLFKKDDGLRECAEAERGSLVFMV